MTPDRLRQLADAATPGPWRFVDGELFADSGDGTGPLLSQTDHDAALIAALGPNAARLLADMAGALLVQPCRRDWDDGRPACNSGDDPIEQWCTRCYLLARFAALGEDK